MKFTVAGNKIICSRDDKSGDRDQQHRSVVEFDAHVESVPPHVAARLRPREIRELKQFLAERQSIRDSSPEINMLEVLPDLIDEVSGVLAETGGLDRAAYRRLRDSVTRLAHALEEVRPMRIDTVTPIRGMRSTEALKERLEQIRQDL